VLADLRAVLWFALMPRFRLDIEYDGSGYAGWQRQAGQHSVQAAIEQAVKGFCAQDVTIRGAGRTDSGVHAIGQVAHVDLVRDWPADTVRDAVNAHLQMAGEAVSVLAASAVPDDFDARFSAIGRHYLYRIVNRRAPLALEAKRAWWVPKQLDVDAMHEAAQLLVGRHDFTTFRSIHCQAKSPVKTLDRLDVTGTGEAIEIRASARSFLHNQVRSMVGSLKRVGEGGWNASDVRSALGARDRAACGPVAPPDGLYLMKVDYPVAASGVGIPNAN
jgi:tRNA pseudouridine38-40 synthase